jgi:hypothetical protein
MKPNSLRLRLKNLSCLRHIIKIDLQEQPYSVDFEEDSGTVKM